MGHWEPGVDLPVSQTGGTITHLFKLGVYMAPEVHIKPNRGTVFQTLIIHKQADSVKISITVGPLVCVQKCSSSPNNLVYKFTGLQLIHSTFLYFRFAGLQ